MSVSMISDLLAQAERITLRRSGNAEAIELAKAGLVEAGRALEAARQELVARQAVLHDLLTPLEGEAVEIDAIYGRLEEFGISRDVASAQVDQRIALVHSLLSPVAPATGASSDAVARVAPGRSERKRAGGAPVVDDVALPRDPAPDGVAKGSDQTLPDEPTVSGEMDREPSVDATGQTAPEVDPVTEGAGDADPVGAPEGMDAPQESAGTADPSEDDGVLASYLADEPDPVFEDEPSEEPEDADISEKSVTADEVQTADPSGDVVVEAPAPEVSVEIVQPATKAEGEAAPGVSPGSRRRSSAVPAFLLG